MYAMNVQNDIIDLVQRENCKSKQMTDFIAWPSRCHDTIIRVLSDGISQAFLPFRFVDVIVITEHDLFWNVGQANCILKYFENMMIDHSDSTIF
jgi:hypothetical protein